MTLSLFFNRLSLYLHTCTCKDKVYIWANDDVRIAFNQN